MKFFDLDIRRDRKDGESVIVLEQTLVDYSSNDFENQQIILSIDQIDLLIAELKKEIINFKSEN